MCMQGLYLYLMYIELSGLRCASTTLPLQRGSSRDWTPEIATAVAQAKSRAQAIVHYTTAARPGHPAQQHAIAVHARQLVTARRIVHAGIGLLGLNQGLAALSTQPSSEESWKERCDAGLLRAQRQWHASVMQKAGHAGSREPPCRRNLRLGGRGRGRFGLPLYVCVANSSLLLGRHIGLHLLMFVRAGAVLTALRQWQYAETKRTRAANPKEHTLAPSWRCHTGPTCPTRSWCTSCSTPDGGAPHAALGGRRGLYPHRRQHTGGRHA